MAQASALFALSADGGSTYATPGVAFADSAALPYNASGTYSIKAKLDSTAGVDSVSWAMVSADDAHVASLPAVTTNSDKSASLSVTKTGGAWLLRCVVNGGVNLQTGAADPTLTSSLAIKVLNSAGNQEIAVGETIEAGVYGYTKAFNDIARAVAGGGGAPSGPAGGDLSGTYPNPQIASGVIVNADVNASAAIAGTKIASDFGTAQDVKGRAFVGTSGRSFNTGLARLDVSAGGSISVGTGYYEYHTIELVGSPASNVTLSFPTGTNHRGGRWTVRNITGSATRWIKIADGGSGIWIPPGMSRTVGLGNDDVVRVSDGIGSSFEMQFSIAAPSGVTMAINSLFLLPAGWVLETVIEKLVTAPAGTPSLTTNVGIAGTGGSGDFFASGAPDITGKPRGYVSTDWSGTGPFAAGWYGDSADQQVSQYFDVTSGSAAGGVVVYTFAGRRLTA